METCVLLPRELSVVLQPFPSKRTSGGGSEGTEARSSTTSSSGGDREADRAAPAHTPTCSPAARSRRPAGQGGSPTLTPGRPLPAAPSLAALEMGATVWSNCHLHPGMTFTPDQGNVRLEKLEIYKRAPLEDIRYQFGMFDEIHLIDDEEVRHCNWIRFLRSSSNMEDVNMVALRVGGHVFFQVVTPIPANGEVTVFYDLSESSLSCSITDSVLRKERLSLGETQDMSPPASATKTPSRSPDSTRSLGAHSIMMTSPSDKEDDVRSTISDVTTASEDSHLSQSAKSSFSSSFSSEARTPVPKMASPSPGRGCLSMETARMGISPPTTHPSPSATFSSPNMTSPSGTMTSPMTSPAGSVTSPSAFPGKSPEEYMRIPAKRNRERTWLPCEVCGKKFDRPSLLRRHMRTHTGEKPHACDVCGKAFSTSSSLNTHRRIHSGEKPHQCPICGKRFTASSNLYYHRMTHNKDKPHKCTLCSKSFPTPGDLKSHMYVHNGSWPYKCDVCNRGFSKHTNLKNHLLLHTGDKPHECDLCGKRFALQCNLKTHMKTHEGEPQEECFKCGKVYLVSSRQVFNGYCRTCLQGPSAGAQSGTHTSPPGPSPGPGGPSPGGGPGGGAGGMRPHSFSVESLATSSVPQSPTVGLAGVPGGGGNGVSNGGTPGGPAAALSMSGYAMFDAKPTMVTVSGVPTHPGASALLSYATGIPWPKLVPQQY